MENKPDLKSFVKFAPNPLFAGLSDFIKDPANYDKIQKTLIESLATKHSHSDLFAWSICVPCQRKLLEHRTLMRKFGFKNAQVYYGWKKVMNVIKKKEQKFA